LSEETLVIDSSTLISLEKSDLLNFLDNINFKLLIPESVKKETRGICDSFGKISTRAISGNTLKLSRDLQKIGIGTGEADCVALAKSLKLKFVVCDDRKLIRQVFFSKNKNLRVLRVLGFSFLLDKFFRDKLVDDIWKTFDNVIKRNNWERSVVQIYNYAFLKKLGY